MKYNIKTINKILIANRGEIAIRIIRTCEELNIKTVAIFSNIDKNAQHIQYASEAYFLGNSYLQQSYLCIDTIIKIAKISNADAIHPGYGFLSENLNFIKAIEKAQLIFIGPTSQTAEIMSNKNKARQFVKKHNIPVIPGFINTINNKEISLEQIKNINFPIMIKASAGAGGKGIKKIIHKEDFTYNFIQLQHEAKKLFNNNELYIEQYISEAKHIEIQIASDSYNNVIYFPERECSVQRRNQKIIEESPSSFIDDTLRHKIGNIAIYIAQKSNYLGLGTIEFLIDKNKNIYFMEMNTRLQVEHPISEMITGIDMVAMQIHIANNKPILYKQSNIKYYGWSIEARVCAENPEKNFIPTPGIIKNFKQPGGPFTRIDSGITNFSTIPIEYDSMIAKIITWGTSRTIAINRLCRALQETTITGITNNINFLYQILKHKDFQTGEYNTNILKDFSFNHNYKNTSLTLIAATIFNIEKNKSHICTTDNTHKKHISYWRKLSIFNTTLQ